MARSMDRRKLFSAAFALAAAASCNAVLGIEEGDPRSSPQAGFCEGKTELTPVPEQTPGDCIAVVCDGNGKTKVIEDALDADDNNPCTADQCMGSAPVHAPLAEVPCYTGQAGTDGVGICKAGIQKCDPQGNLTAGCVGEVLPEAEQCKTIGDDDDCDGLTDEGGADCACGDGIVSADLSEQCDDGGTADGDPCSPTCQDQHILDVWAGYQHTCARLSGGRIKCWGAGSAGALGLGDTESRGDVPGEMGSALPPVDLGPGSIVTSMTGSAHTCALLEGGAVKCWGNNDSGQLGLGDTKNRGDQPEQMGDALPFVNLGQGEVAEAIAAGSSHTCALLKGGSVKCWGLNTAGQLGLGGTQKRGDQPGEMGDALPTVNLGQDEVATAIAAGSSHTCALLQGGSIKCWGANTAGQLGLGDTNPRGEEPGDMGDALPTVDLGQGKAATAIAAGSAHTCALLQGGSIKCWGSSNTGQLGLGDKEDRGDGPGEMGDALPAVDLGAGRTAEAIMVSLFKGCALLDDGSVKCWGDNASGDLGLGDQSDRGDGPGEMGDALPAVDLGGGGADTALSITAGLSHTCALLTYGALKCWGSGVALGLGSTNGRGDNPGEMGDNLPTVKLFSNAW